jgi:hypothetical protein
MPVVEAMMLFDRLVSVLRVGDPVEEATGERRQFG